MVQEVGPTGLYGGGGGGGGNMHPGEYYRIRCGNGGKVVVDMVVEPINNPPTQQNPSPFVSEWPEPSPGYQYARPGHQYLGGGGGGAQAYPTSMLSGQGGSGCFMLRYAVPGV